MADEHWKEPINITKEQWMVLLEDRDIITEKDIQLLELIYACDDYMATGSQLAQLLNMPHHGPLNIQVGRLGKKIVKKLNIQAPKRENGSGRWWHVPFWGSGRREGYYWILRPELKDAMYELGTMGEIVPIDGETFPEEIDLNDYTDLYEGAKKQIYVNSYERSDAARERCVRHYGARCIICGFDFEKIYGEVGRNVIHVHHLKPLCEIGETYSVDPIKDLRPVCPNCHVMIHRNNPAYSIDEVMAMIKDTKVLALEQFA